jgi:DNA-binding transcriptional ArsR family regulator
MDVFAAIADPVRRDLLRALSGGSARVVDLAAGREISRPAVSKHLRVLADAGLVVADDVGRERHYRMLAEGLGDVAGLLAELVPGATRPPVTVTALDGLDLEVRRVGRDRRAGQASTHGAEHAPHRQTGETA